MTKEQIDKASLYLTKLDILEEALNSVTNSRFDGEHRTEEVSEYIHNGCLNNDCIAMLSKEDCKEINQAIYNVLVRKIKENRDILEKI